MCVTIPLKQDYLILSLLHLLILKLESGNSDTIKELKLTAKWSVDSNEKKKAILQLLRYGHEARPAIEEVLGVTAYNDVKQACLNAISSLGRIRKDKSAKNNYKISKTKTTSNLKKQKKKTKRRSS